ncbi:type I 3-dehydroquinate dehydratase [Desulfitobacterium metallireducens]|uniref:3-dehydroquinate dehydratase n=1 Tax=Desulfitobacterium metallireducens DSM 15288 TaxID=871968 RepID=W0E9C1_9FIRM|nr:type I 3-dehydroquinate dehydratase [Desulfitobacterium metallireducens]AHF06123.1 3-dehydroquinate dehydratase [Desulfitobacterium metallireducens DSM 15288]
MKRQRIGEGNQPLICTPLVGKQRESIRLELHHVLEKRPDLIEWRVDFFEGIANTEKVLDLAQEIKESAGDIPLIFTLRSVREGGQPVSLNDQEALKLIEAICQKTEVEYVDFELSNSEEAFKELRQVSLESQTQIIASYHNFEFTPESEILLGKIAEAQRLSADVAKIAVMSQNLHDVLTLLKVTLNAKETVDIPLISLAMGQYGTITRMMGGVFGSSVTFAVGESSSAPGQMPIEDLRSVLGILQKSIGQV